MTLSVKLKMGKKQFRNLIVCSAFDQKKVIVEAIEAGAKDFIIKPFNET
jgi:two-component system chemotaxis response regulator CheY